MIHTTNDSKQIYGDLVNAIDEELHRIFDSEGMEKGKDYLFISSRGSSCKYQSA